MSKVLIGLAVTLLAVSGCSYNTDQQPVDTRGNGYFYYYNESNLKDYSLRDYDFDIELS